MGYNLLYGEVPKIRSSRVPGSISKSITSEEVEGAERAAREARSGWVRGEMWVIPSGKHTKNYGKIHHFLMGESTISTGPFSIAMLVYQRVTWDSMGVNGQKTIGI